MLRGLFHTTRSLAIVLLILSLATVPSFGVDGVVEINQVRAKVGGVTPGDSPKFPVTLDHSGSYRLTGNLDVTDASARASGVAAENTTAILITADNVTVDLNGFTIKGATTCGAPPSASCSPTGSGKGIDGATYTGLTVSNGTVQGMGSDGMSLGDEAFIDKVHSRHNGGNGFLTSAAGVIISNCNATTNGKGGITGATIVTSSIANGNHNEGIEAGIVANCFANVNGYPGTGAHGINSLLATGSAAASNDTSPEIVATGVTGHNLCNFAACP